MGRYRCAVCYALGYRGIANQLDDGRSMSAKIAGKFMKPSSRGITAIIPYRCKTTDCKMPAVNRKPQKCAPCMRKRKV